MNGLERLDELAQIAAEQALDILSEDSLQLVDDIRFAASRQLPGQDVLQVDWIAAYDETNSLLVSMVLLHEHLDDEEALVLSMAAWILHSIRGSDDSSMVD